jgi:3'-5' exonuclease
MIKTIHPQHILFLDVATVPRTRKLEELSPRWQHLWEKKQEPWEKASLEAEFGKVISICTGRLKERQNEWLLEIKKTSGDDEAAILQDVLPFIERMERGRPIGYLCAHNGREFDFPYLCRRLLANGMRVPSILDVRGKFPRETQLLDTMEIWRFGHYRHCVSLELLAASLGIENLEPYFDGSLVYSAYYEDHDLEKISGHCEAQVITLAKVYLKMAGFHGEILTNTSVLQNS